MYKKLVGVAKELRDMNNFSSAMAVLTAFNMAAIERMKFTTELHGKLASVTLSL